VNDGMTTSAMPAPRRSALLYLVAAIVHAVCTVFALRWLIADWNAQWADDTFIHAVYLSYGGMLIPAFGKWLFMAIPLLYLGTTALLLMASAALFRFSSRERYLKACAYLSLMALPAGTLAGMHALRVLKQRAAGTPR
jgi:hypothetical protein